eukprot:g3072.t1
MNAAATRLKETAPTVSRKIDELERTLNARLLYRSPRGVSLTDAGRKALRYAEIMSDAADGLRSDVLDHDLPAEGPVTLCAGDGLAAHWIAPHLPDFHLQNPKIELRLVTTDRPDTDLLDDKADIAIQFQEPGGRQDIVSKRLGILHYIFWASPEYLRTFGNPTSIFDAHEHRCIIHSGYVNQVEQWAPKAQHFKDLIDFALVTNSGSVMLEVCANGGGIALMPTYVWDLKKNLVPLNLPEVAPIRFWLTYPERGKHMGTDKLIDQELPQWTKSVRRHAYFAQSIETEEMADAELDVQLNIIDALSRKPASSPLDMLLKLKLWESYVSPDGDLENMPPESELIRSVIGDLEAFVDTAGASMASYGAAKWAKVS